MILNQAQAEAVYSAMCALNNVGGRVSVTFGQQLVAVGETKTGAVIAYQPESNQNEVYPNQSAFATAYGLQQG